VHLVGFYYKNANKKLDYIHKNVKVRLTMHYILKVYWRLLV